jgi:HAD superfamily hydrolase (TIGR01509 family)
MTTVKCLIFDCDGTLVDSEYLCNKGLAIKLDDDYGIGECAQSLMKRYRGWKLANIVQDLEEIHTIKFPADFVYSYRLIVSKLFKSELQPIPEVETTLKAIDLPKCVASSGPMDKIQESLKLTGLSIYFSGNLFSSYDIKSWKPDPALFLHAAQVMGFRPEECAVIEDSSFGIDAALAANMLPIYYSPEGYKYSNRHVESLTKISQLINMIYK